MVDAFEIGGSELVDRDDLRLDAFLLEKATDLIGQAFRSSGLAVIDDQRLFHPCVSLLAVLRPGETLLGTRRIRTSPAGRLGPFSGPAQLPASLPRPGARRAPAPLAARR